MRKNPGKFRELENPIWNTFYYLNFFQISTDFELFKRFPVKVGLTKLCSHRLIATLIANPSELYFGQEVVHGDPQCLHYYLVDVHRLSPQIDEVMEFPKRLNVKQILKKLSICKLGCIALFGPFKQILLDLNNCCRFAHL
jgi:hypothetical protein